MALAKRAKKIGTAGAALVVALAMGLMFLAGAPARAATAADPPTLVNWWLNQGPSVGANTSPVMDQTVINQAQPDECFNAVGQLTQYNPNLPNGGCDTTQQILNPSNDQPYVDPITGNDVMSGPKTNQAYVWGLTNAQGNLFYGTAANVECLVMGAYLGLGAPQVNSSYACEFGSSQYAKSINTYVGMLKTEGLLTTQQAGRLAGLVSAAGDWRPPHAYMQPTSGGPSSATLLDPGTLNVSAPGTTNGFFPNGIPSITANGSADALDAARFVYTLGLRSAGTSPDGSVVFLAGPALLPDQLLPIAGVQAQAGAVTPSSPMTAGINMFAFDAATGKFLGSQNFPQYSDIRQFLTTGGHLYTAAGSTVLQWTPPTPIQSSADYFDFTPVGTLQMSNTGDSTVIPEEGANLAVLDGHLYVSTWPTALAMGGGGAPSIPSCTADPTSVACSAGVSGVWMSPQLDPTNGLVSTGQAAPLDGSPSWTKVWSALQYEPDPIIARTYAMGAITAYDGQLYWGTMHVPFLATIAEIGYWLHQGVGFSSDSTVAQAQILSDMVATQRSISVFRGGGFDTDSPQVDLLYGDAQLPVFGPVDLGTWSDGSGNAYGWRLEPNTATGQQGLYGASGFGNPFNNYTWSMKVFNGRLFVGTMDWSYLAVNELPTIISMLTDASGTPGIQLTPVTVASDLLPLAWNPGADLWRFDGPSTPAVAEDMTGLGDYGSYGVRTMTTDGSSLFVGMANPMNLMTAPQGQQEATPAGTSAEGIPVLLPNDPGPGGWQLLKLTPTQEMAPPTVTSVNPSSGGTAGGDTVTVTGTGFNGATDVYFGTADVTSFQVNGTFDTITVTDPAGSAGTVDVTVKTPWGTSATSSADHFTYTAPAPPPPPPFPGGGGGTTGGGSGGSSVSPTSRIAGGDRIGTAIATSQQSFANGSAGAVVLARTTDYPDALAGSPLAVADNAPILLTPTGSLDPSVAAEIQRVLPAGGTVFLLGGTNALSTGLESQVQALGYHTVRYGGSNRYATAVSIASSLPSVNRILVANGANFPDAVSASAATGPAGTVIVLTNGSAMPSETAAFLAAHAVPTFAIGGPAAAADPAATAVDGSDRYATSVDVAQQFFTAPKGAGMASGMDFPDALVAGPRLARLGEPLLLTDPASLPASVSGYLTANKATITHVEIYGGTAAVSSAIDTAIASILSA